MKNFNEYINESLLDNEEDLLNNGTVEWLQWLRNNINFACKKLNILDTNIDSFGIKNNGKKYIIYNINNTEDDTLYLNLPDGTWPKELELDDTIKGLYIYSTKSKVDLNNLVAKKLWELLFAEDAINHIDMSKSKVDIIHVFQPFCKNLKSIDLRGIDSIKYLQLYDCRKLKIDSLKFPQLCDNPQLPREILFELKQQLVKGTHINIDNLKFG